VEFPANHKRQKVHELTFNFFGMLKKANDGERFWSFSDQFGDILEHLQHVVLAVHTFEKYEGRIRKPTQPIKERMKRGGLKV
jgi:hypothetical protein